MYSIEVLRPGHNDWSPWFHDGRTVTSKDAMTITRFIHRHFNIPTRVQAAATAA